MDSDYDIIDSAEASTRKFSPTHSNRTVLREPEPPKPVIFIPQKLPAEEAGSFPTLHWCLGCHARTIIGTDFLCDQCRAPLSNLEGVAVSLPTYRNFLRGFQNHILYCPADAPCHSINAADKYDCSGLVIAKRGILEENTRLKEELGRAKFKIEDLETQLEATQAKATRAEAALRKIGLLDHLVRMHKADAERRLEAGRAEGPANVESTFHFANGAENRTDVVAKRPPESQRMLQMNKNSEETAEHGDPQWWDEQNESGANKWK